MFPQTPTSFGCIYCNRSNFTTQHALNRHQSTGVCGKLKQNDIQGQTSDLPSIPLANTGINSKQNANDSDDLLPWLPASPPRKQALSRLEVEGIEAHDMDAVTRQMGALFAEGGDSDEESSDYEGAYDYLKYEDSGQIEGKNGHEAYSSDEYSEFGDDRQENLKLSPDSDATNHETLVPDTYIRDQFKEYCAYASKNFLPFTQQEVKTIRLLHLLKEKMPRLIPMNLLCFGTFIRPTSYVHIRL